jgi:hypothetical protein
LIARYWRIIGVASAGIVAAEGLLSGTNPV